jgi:DNA-binding HxlR family transcriptional regulator
MMVREQGTPPPSWRGWRRVSNNYRGSPTGGYRFGRLEARLNDRHTIKTRFGRGCAAEARSARPGGGCVRQRAQVPEGAELGHCQIAKELEDFGEGLPVKQGTLYPVLRSLEAGGLLSSEVEPSVTGPPRRYYSVTDEGKHAIGLWQESWKRTREFVDAVLEGHRG